MRYGVASSFHQKREIPGDAYNLSSMRVPAVAVAISGESAMSGHELFVLEEDGIL